MFFSLQICAFSSYFRLSLSLLCLLVLWILLFVCFCLFVCVWLIALTLHRYSKSCSPSELQYLYAPLNIQVHKWKTSIVDSLFDGHAVKDQNIAITIGLNDTRCEMGQTVNCLFFFCLYKQNSQFSMLTMLTMLNARCQSFIFLNGNNTALSLHYTEHNTLHMNFTRSFLNIFISSNKYDVFLLVAVISSIFPLNSI